MNLTRVGLGLALFAFGSAAVFAQDTNTNETNAIDTSVNNRVTNDQKTQSNDQAALNAANGNVGSAAATDNAALNTLATDVKATKAAQDKYIYDVNHGATYAQQLADLNNLIGDTSQQSSDQANANNDNAALSSALAAQANANKAYLSAVSLTNADQKTQDSLKAEQSLLNTQSLIVDQLRDDGTSLINVQTMIATALTAANKRLSDAKAAVSKCGGYTGHVQIAQQAVDALTACQKALNASGNSLTSEETARIKDVVNTETEICKIVTPIVGNCTGADLSTTTQNGNTSATPVGSGGL